MKLKLAHVCLGSPDLAKSENFYRHILGLRRVFEFLKDGQLAGFYFAAGDGTYIEIFKDNPATVANSPLKHFCLETDNIDEVIQRLHAAGFKPTPKKLGCDQTWQSWVDSPEGV